MSNNKRHFIIYIAGKYTDNSKTSIQKNILTSRKYAIKLWDRGFTVITPHLNVANFEYLLKKTTYDDITEGSLEIISRCDAVFMLPNWKRSNGAKIERKYAYSKNITVYYNLKELDDDFKYHPLKELITNAS